MFMLAERKNDATPATVNCTFTIIHSMTLNDARIARCGLERNEILIVKDTTRNGLGDADMIV